MNSKTGVSVAAVLLREQHDRLRWREPAIRGSRAGEYCASWQWIMHPRRMDTESPE